MIEIANCHICYGKDFVELTDSGDKFDGEKANICLTCGLVFLSPRMSGDELADYYGEGTFNKDFRSQDFATYIKHPRLERLAKTRMAAFGKHLDGAETLLEIGCGAGAFLRLAEEVVPNTYGVDPTEHVAEYLKDHNKSTIRTGSFPEESFEDLVDKFDVIVVFHVLEHVEDPRGFLRAIHDRLSDNGILIVEYPDIEVAAKGRTKLAPNYFQRSHLYDFSGFSLLNLFSELNFGVEEVTRPDPNYPTDKNVAVVCRKTDVQLEGFISPERAAELRDLIIDKLDAGSLLLNFGAKLRVVHIGSHNINVGDGAISAGIRATTSAIVNNAVDFFAMDIVDYLGQITVDNINSYHPDLVLIGGGGTIDGHQSRIETGTAFTLAPNEIEKINAPCAFVALGHNVFPDQEFHNVDILNDFILSLKSMDVPFSVRRDRSYERLANVLSSDAIEYVQRVPDPGFFIGQTIPANPFTPHFSPLAKRKIVMQISGDAMTNRLGDNYEAFYDQISILMQSLLNIDAETYIVLALHTYDDVYAQTLISFTKYIDMYMRRAKLRSTGIAHPVYAPNFFSTYANADLVIGMRGHSIICSTGLGIPTVALSTHDKVAGFMEEAGASEWVLDVRNVDSVAESTYDMVAELMNNPQRQLDAIQTSTANWQNELALFLHDVLNKV